MSSELKSFEELKKEFRRIQREFSDLLFNAETFEQGIKVMQMEKMFIPPIVAALRLMNDLRNLDQITLDHQEKYQKSKELSRK